MALSFPRTDISWPLLKASQTSFRLITQQEITFAPAGLMAADIGPAYWEVSYEFAPSAHDDSLTLEAALNSLDGSIQRWRAGDLRRIYPLNHPDPLTWTDSGVISSLPSDRSLIGINTLPASFHVAPGDYFHYTHAGNRYLHQIMEEVTATAGGDLGQVTVRPYIPAAVDASAIGTAVKFKTPRATMVLVPGSVEFGTVNKLKSAGRFKGVQVLA